MKAKHIFILLMFLGVLCIFCALVGGAAVIGSLPVKAQWADMAQFKASDNLFVYPDRQTGELVLVLIDGEYAIPHDQPLVGCFKLNHPEKKGVRGYIERIGDTCPHK